MPNKRTHQADTLRIIGGQCRGRKLHFTEVADLRPTPDRIRETVFNWLQHTIVGANCIDLFAGSGALGVEALSRGAETCLFIDKHPQCIKDINRNMVSLNTRGGKTLLGDTLQLLARPVPAASTEKNTFTIAFVDPPYGLDCANQCCHLLADNQWLANKSYIYIESATRINEKQLPENWHLHRQKKSGNVNYHLAIQQL